MEYMKIKGEDCVTAAEQIREELLLLSCKIERLQDPLVGPDNPLPVDTFLTNMVERVNAPRIILEPKRLKGHLWTESVTVYVYACIEEAFAKAGRLPGSNRVGHKLKLEKLKEWVQLQTSNPNRKVPKYFVQNNALLFAYGILDERRRERIAVLTNIQHSTRTAKSDLNQLEEWIEYDLADNRINAKGRSKDYQKIAFANEIAVLWKKLTGKPVTRGPDTNFAKFLTACWKSGFIGMEANSNFKRSLREHVSV